MQGVSSLEEQVLPIASSSPEGRLPAGQSGLCTHARVPAQVSQAQAQCWPIFSNSAGAYDSLVPAPRALDAGSGWQAARQRTRHSRVGGVCMLRHPPMAQNTTLPNHSHDEFQVALGKYKQSTLTCASSPITKQDHTTCDESQLPHARPTCIRLSTAVTTESH